jgi:hypothetical protein
MRSALFWDSTQRRVVIPNRRFGTELPLTLRHIPDELKAYNTTWNLLMSTAPPVVRSEKIISCYVCNLFSRLRFCGLLAVCDQVYLLTVLPPIQEAQYPLRRHITVWRSTKFIALPGIKPCLVFRYVTASQRNVEVPSHSVRFTAEYCGEWRWNRWLCTCGVQVLSAGAMLSDSWVGCPPRLI